MAHQQEEPGLPTLIARIEASRRHVAADVAELRHQLDVPARVKRSVKAKPAVWLGGSLGAGFLASLLLKRRRHHHATASVREEKAKVKGGLFGMLLGGAFSIARPALQNWALREFQSRFAQPRYSQDKHP
ncbi:hypothetical protein [Haloferula sp. BvORR071]|uniref:hypothetical protein n=1 Tax=Haloferula sp. BvORR071 TaxID=1396141 RepID=UPI000554AF7C|nr:hypothetical protein [Haloferula sp. BvORR071]